MALALTSAALDVHAAGLGRLNLMSGIGQPLRAEIELTSVARDEAGSLTARLASPDAFGQAGIEYGSALSSLRFSIQRRASGQQYVLVTSNALVNDPYLDVLVELSWSSGRLVREYTMLLDPPETRAARTEVDPGSLIIRAESREPGAAASPAAAPRAARASVATGTASPSTATAGTSSGDYVVQNGDTAMSIARANKPDRVGLEQMLAALYRDNPQAFGGNIDKLMAGATLKLPDAAAAQGISAPDAQRIVAQSADFGRYRDRIAQNAAQAPTSRAANQQASGRLSTQVQDGAPAADARDRLQLSRPDATRATTGAATPPAATRGGAGGPSAEDLAAKDRELVETRTRLAQLEKSVADLQQLLKLKNQTLADLQKSGPGTTPPAAPTPTVAVAPVAEPVSPPTAPAPAVSTPPVAAVPMPAPAPAPAPSPSPAATPSAVAPVPAATPKAAPLAPSTTDGNWYDALLDNTLLLAGIALLILLILAYAVITMIRRRKLAGFEDSIFVDNSVLHANSVFGTTGGQSVDTANSGFHSNFVPVAGNLPEQNEVDPVAEADVYIAYGRDAQAEEILKEALRADDKRQAVRLKLLEIYAKRGDAKTFETVASELYAATGGQGDDWAQAATLGAGIDPRNPLYAEPVVAVPVAAAIAGGQPPAATTSSPATPHAATSFAATEPYAPGHSDAVGMLAAGGAAFSLSGLGATEAKSESTSRDLMRTDPMPRTDAPASAAPSMDLDFDLGLGGSVTPLQAVTTPKAPVPPADESLDFDISQSTRPLVDPFTASAFGSDATIRTAVNLPAFRARAEQPPTSDAPPPPRQDAEGFTASDIFGSSIVADPQSMYGETPLDPTPPAARTSDFRHDLDAHAFDKTEPLDAFSKINLDLDDGGYGAPEKSDFGAKTDVWQAMATKLDLALAYSDIGDKDGARELLEEVVRNGDQTQADRAKTLIGELG